MMRRRSRPAAAGAALGGSGQVTTPGGPAGPHVPQELRHLHTGPTDPSATSQRAVRSGARGRFDARGRGVPRVVGWVRPGLAVRVSPREGGSDLVPRRHAPRASAVAGDARALRAAARRSARRLRARTDERGLDHMVGVAAGLSRTRARGHRHLHGGDRPPPACAAPSARTRCRPSNSSSWPSADLEATGRRLYWLDERQIGLGISRHVPLGLGREVEERAWRAAEREVARAAARLGREARERHRPRLGRVSGDPAVG
jgi:hypothetical protein